MRRCGSQEGNALAVCCRLGLADDPRVQLLAESLVEWQWPDGGWNCDKNATGRRSSFNESLAPMWGLHEYWTATGDDAAKEAATRTAELFLEHRLFRVGGNGGADPSLVRRPSLSAVLALRHPSGATRALPHGPGKRPARGQDAIELLEERRLADGRWRAGGRWWKPPGANGGNVEVVDWGRSGQSEMVTLNALRVLHAAK